MKNVTGNEEFFSGHFPGRPVMPAVLVIEAMAQVGAILMLDIVERPDEKIPMFTSIDKAKFRKPVVPGDQIYLEVEMLRRRSSSCKMLGKAYVTGDLVAQAELMAIIVDKSEA